MTVIGIDLGTTNTGVAIARPEQPVELFPIPQLVNAGEVRTEPLLPSFLYLPGKSDFPDGATALPWDGAPSWVVGALAQKRGTEAASRLVSSAKSWLSYAGVDRTSELLPVGAPEGTRRVSPVEASRRYLEHVRRAWEHEFPKEPFAKQRVLVTVPASFDAVARELTLEAARKAGCGDVVLLEEPQAAFYAWIEKHTDWRERVQVGDLILVADIGGGTTDFTLIAVTESKGDLALERVAVGEHILLGGDNMDLALARSFELQLDALQLHALWQQCRVAKETLLDPAAKKTEHPVTILGKGSSLIGGTIKRVLRQEDVLRILRDGFFPEVASDEMPERRRRAALQEIGLPYATDAAITRHLARFLRQQAAAAEHGSVRRGPSGLACPTHVLFNGGVLRAGPVRERLLEVLGAWLQNEGFAAPAVLEGEDLMHAVSRGAAYFGLAREGKGIRIRGGVPRTYYVGIEDTMPAVPGMAAPLKALTVVPFGLEEGSDLKFTERAFGLVVGEPAEFRFFCSSSRKNDAAGAVLERIDDEFEELPPMEVTLPVEAGSAGVVPATLETVVTETGLLQLWCVAKDGRRWKLEFNVRESMR